MSNPIVTVIKPSIGLRPYIRYYCHRLFCLSSCQAAVVFACEAGILCEVFVDTPQAFVTISG